MGIQSAVNKTIGTFAAVRKAHDLTKKQTAMQNMEEQKLAIAESRVAVAKMKELNKRRQLRLTEKYLKNLTDKENK